MKIRKAKKEELKEIAKIFKKESLKKPYVQKWTIKKAFEKMVEAHKANNLLIISINKKIAGLMIVSINSDNKTNVHVSELWIKSNNQGKGLGKAFMKEIEEKYKKRGVKTIQLVSNRKSKAYGFYKKLKYKEYKDLVFMERKLK